MRKAVLFINTGIFAGPVFTVNRSIIRWLDRARYRPVVAVDSNIEGALELPGDVEVTRWTFGPGARHRLVTDVRRGPLALARFVRREKIAVLHCSQETVCSFLGIALGRVTGAKVLVHQHTAPDRGGPLPMRRIAIDLADANVGVSRFISGSIHEHAPRRRHVDWVANGVDVAAFHPGVSGRYVRRHYGVADDEILLVQLGRFEDYKRQEDFARAFVIAKREVPKLRGLVIGWEDPRHGGSHRRRIDAICREAGLGDALLADDARPDAANVHAAADAFVMPSVDEPFGLVVAEAMACGKPVLAVRSGALPEIVVDGHTGLLTAPRNPAELARSMVTIARDPLLRARLGAGGRDRAVREFSEQRLGAQFAVIYDRLAASARS